MTPPAYSPVVVVVDPGSSHRPAVTWGADEADRRHLPLRLIRVQGWSPGRWPPSHSTADHTLTEAVAYARSRHPHLEVSPLYAVGDLGPVLREQARTAAVVVLGPCGSGTREAPSASGAVALPVIARADCPVVVVRDPGHAGRQSPYFVVGVDVGVDGRRHSEAVLDHAFRQAALHGAELRVLYVWHRPVLGVLDEHAALRECRMLLAEAVTSRRAAHPEVKVHHRVVRGRPVQVLSQESARALGLFVGTRRHGRLTGVPFGSVVRGALRQARCPVVAVPEPGGHGLPRVRPRAGRLMRRVRGARVSLRPSPTGVRRRAALRLRGAVWRSRRHAWWRRWRGFRP